MKNFVKIFSFLVLLVLFIPQNIWGKEDAFAKNTFGFSTEQESYSFHFKNIPLHNSLAYRPAKELEERTEEITHKIKKISFFSNFYIEFNLFFLLPSKTLNINLINLYFKKTLYLLYQSLRL